MIGRNSPGFLVSNVLDRGLVNPGFFYAYFSVFTGIFPWFADFLLYLRFRCIYICSTKQKTIL